MPILVHRLLGIAVRAVGGFGGAMVRFCLGSLLFMALAAGRDAGAPRVLLGAGYVCVMVIVVTCFCIGAWLGSHLCFWLFGCDVPARCPQCKGRIYLQEEGPDEVRYGCRSCGHMYLGKSWQE
jgi:hypothetical protein